MVGEHPGWRGMGLGSTNNSRKTLLGQAKKVSKSMKDVEQRKTVGYDQNDDKADELAQTSSKSCLVLSSQVGKTAVNSQGSPWADLR